MIIVTKVPKGLHLQRDDRADPPLFVADDEVAAAIAELITHATPTAVVGAESWDTWAWLCGNDEAAVLV